MTEEKKKRTVTKTLSKCERFEFKTMASGLRITVVETGATAKFSHSQWEELYNIKHRDKWGSTTKLHTIDDDVRYWCDGVSYYGASIHNLPPHLKGKEVFSFSYGYPTVKAAIKSFKQLKLLDTVTGLEIAERFYGYRRNKSRGSGKLVDCETLMTVEAHDLLRQIPKLPPRSEWPQAKRKKRERQDGEKIRLTKAQQAILDGWNANGKNQTYGWPEGTQPTKDNMVKTYWRHQIKGHCSMDCLHRHGLVERGLVGVKFDKDGNLDLSSSYPSLAYRITTLGALRKSS